MTTITLPPEVEGPLAEEAERQGTTPELLAIGCLRKLFASHLTGGQPAEGETLSDFLAGYVGTVNGTTDPLSENCGRRWSSTGAWRWACSMSRECTDRGWAAVN